MKNFFDKGLRLGRQCNNRRTKIDKKMQ